VLLPLSIRLITGGTQELKVPLADIIYSSPTTTVRLDALVKQGYSVRVRFEANQAAADWAKPPTLDWHGEFGGGGSLARTLVCCSSRLPALHVPAVRNASAVGRG